MHLFIFPNRNSENTDFLDTIIFNVLHDITFSRNRPLKSADDRCIRIFKIEIKYLRTS